MMPLGPNFFVTVGEPGAGERKDPRRGREGEIEREREGEQETERH